jgi:hypothetical protein
MKRMSGAGLGVAAAALLAGCGGGSSGAAAGESATVKAAFPGVSGNTDNKVVLNYALTLETLEAYLYLVALNAASGLAATTPLNATSSAYTQTVGNGTVNSSLAAAGYLYLVEFAYVEAAHRDFLKAALGTMAITTLKPSKYNFGLQTMTRAQVLDLVLEAEATGVQAYLGAIPYFKAKSPYLQTAAAIQSNEARHATTLTLVRNVLSSQGIVSDPIAPVAPLSGDPGVISTSGSYNSAAPNAGTSYGADETIQPDQVLIRVGGFIRTT